MNSLLKNDEFRKGVDVVPAVMLITSLIMAQNSSIWSWRDEGPLKEAAERNLLAQELLHAALLFAPGTPGPRGIQFCIKINEFCI